MAQKLEKVKILKITRSEPAKNKNGDEYTRVGIETDKYGWVNGFGNEVTDTFNVDDEIELEVIRNEEYNNYSFKVDYSKLPEREFDPLLKDELDFGEYEGSDVQFLGDGTSEYGKWYRYRLKVNEKNMIYFAKERDHSFLSNTNSALIEVKNYLGRDNSAIQATKDKAEKSADDIISVMGDVTDEQEKAIREKALVAAGTKIVNFKPLS